MAFVRMTERARDVVDISRREAEELRHDHIGTEHVLLGILREGGGIATKLTQLLGLKIDPLRKAVSMLSPATPHGSGAGTLPFSPRLRGAIKTAEETAQKLGHEDIGIAHLFLGLTEDAESKCALLLINLGLDLKSMRSEVLERLSKPRE